MNFHVLDVVVIAFELIAREAYIDIIFFNRNVRISLCLFQIVNIHFGIQLINVRFGIEMDFFYFGLVIT